VPEPAHQPTSIGEFCREIEAYLCRKNNGHLIRIVGPAFDVVSRWAGDGIPIRIVLHGIDRTVERRARKGAQRRPLRIEFCEADVLDAFDDWRRAVGVPATAAEPAAAKVPSLAAHVERVLLRLTNARATNVLGSEFDALIDRVSQQLDVVKAAGRGLKGDRRQALIDRLQTLDAEMLALARGALTGGEVGALASQADAELSAFRERLSVEAYGRARELAIDRLVRDRFSIPTLGFM
jgi:hypothetical protein